MLSTLTFSQTLASELVTNHKGQVCTHCLLSFRQRVELHPSVHWPSVEIAFSNDVVFNLVVDKAHHPFKSLLLFFFSGAFDAAHTSLKFCNLLSQRAFLLLLLPMLSCQLFLTLQHGCCRNILHLFLSPSRHCPPQRSMYTQLFLASSQK